MRLMNVFGDAAEHVILSAVPDALGARDAIDPGVRVSFPGEVAPPLYGKPSLTRYRNLSEYMRGFDLVLTYNWGAMDAVAARRCQPVGQPRLIHHEDGFNVSESERLNIKRNLFRRLMLPTVERLVVPSQRLEDIARDIWKQPAARVLRIPNGIDVGFYSNAAEPNSIPGFVRKPGDIVVGTIAGLRGVKNLPRLVRAVAAQPPHVKLVIVGEGPERAKIIAEAARLGMADRLLLPGFLVKPHRYVGHFDIFALSSDSEQFPISLIEAMAAGLPVVSTDVGDVKAMVAKENIPFVVPVLDESAFANAFARLVQDAALRTTLGAFNYAVAAHHYDERAMVEKYRALYQIPG